MTLERLQGALDVTLTPAFLRNSEGYIIYQNRPAETLLGYDQTEIAQKQLADLYAHDPQVISSTLEDLEQLGHWSGRVRYRTKNGGQVQAEISVFLRTLLDGTSVRMTFVRAVAGKALTSKSVTKAADQFGLSPAQLFLLQLLVEGFSDTQVADVLGLTAEVAAEQVRELVATMGSSSRTEAVITAIKANLVL
jgi:PAS domain S-box-containing protein